MTSERAKLETMMPEYEYLTGFLRKVEEKQKIRFNIPIMVLDYLDVNINAFSPDERLEILGLKKKSVKT